MGSLPTGGAVSWIPVFPSSMSQPVPVMSLSVVTGTQPVIPSVGCVATPYVGSHFGEGLLPVPEKLTQKIIQLEFVEMRDLMPESWLMEEENSRKNTLSFPRKRAAPVTDILQSVFCSCGGGAVEGISNYGARIYVVSGNHHQVCKGFSRAGVGPI